MRSALVSVGAFVAVAPFAHAGLAEPFGSDVGGDSTQLRINGSEGPNDLRVSYPADNTYVVTDTEGVRGCTPIDPQTASCSYGVSPPIVVFSGYEGENRAFFAVGPTAVVQAIGGDGNDHFELEQGSQARARFGGWFEGDDTLIGGAVEDSLTGGRDSDRLNGRSGDDRLYGGSGTDRILGGSGNDRMYAGFGADYLAAGSGDDIVKAAGGSKRLVRCGPGNDQALVDRSLDPAVVRGCETVKLHG